MSHKTAQQWREELKQRLALADAADRAQTAAIIRKFIIDAMLEDNSSLAIVVRGVEIYPAFDTIAAKENYINEMATDRTWLDAPCLHAFAAALDINLNIHAKGSAQSDVYRYKSSQVNAPVFHVANFSGAHWSAALKDEDGYINDLPTPGDGNCGAHALYKLYDIHMGDNHQQALSVMDIQVAEVAKDEALIANCKSALSAVITEQSTDIRSLARALSTDKNKDNSGSSDLGSFFSKRLADTSVSDDSLRQSIINRVSIDQEATNLLCATLLQKGEAELASKLSVALTKVGMFTEKVTPYNNDVAGLSTVLLKQQ